MTNSGTFWIAVTLVAWGAAYAHSAFKNIEKSNALQFAINFCKDDSLDKACEGLLDAGASPTLYLQDTKYQSQIIGKVANAVFDGEFKDISGLDKFTHLYAAENGITLPENFTKRWP